MYSYVWKLWTRTEICEQCDARGNAVRAGAVERERGHRERAAHIVHADEHDEELEHWRAAGEQMCAERDRGSGEHEADRAAWANQAVRAGILLPDVRPGAFRVRAVLSMLCIERLALRRGHH